MGEVTYKPGEVIVHDHAQGESRNERSLWVVVEHDRMYVYVRPINASSQVTTRAIAANAVRHATIVDLAMLRQRLDDMIAYAVKTGDGIIRDA